MTVPALAASGVRTAIDLMRSRDPGLLGALAWWGFDIAVLWAMFHAFGSPPPFTVIWMAYFVGMLGNLLPLPGGLGGVEGGMIGAFAAFGVDFNLAVLAVLVLPGDLLLAAHASPARSPTSSCAARSRAGARSRTARRRRAREGRRDRGAAALVSQRRARAILYKVKRPRRLEMR